MLFQFKENYLLIPFLWKTLELKFDMFSKFFFFMSEMETKC